MGFQASYAMLHCAMTRDDASALWANIQAVTVQKRQLCVQRRIGILVKNLTEFAHRNNSTNLTRLASNFRDSLPVEIAFEVAALFCHFALDI